MATCTSHKIACSLLLVLNCFVGIMMTINLYSSTRDPDSWRGYFFVPKEFNESTPLFLTSRPLSIHMTWNLIFLAQVTSTLLATPFLVWSLSRHSMSPWMVIYSLNILFWSDISCTLFWFLLWLDLWGLALLLALMGVAHIGHLVVRALCRRCVLTVHRAVEELDGKPAGDEGEEKPGDVEEGKPGDVEEGKPKDTEEETPEYEGEEQPENMGWLTIQNFVCNGVVLYFSWTAFTMIINMGFQLPCRVSDCFEDAQAQAAYYHTLTFSTAVYILVVCVDLVATWRQKDARYVIIAPYFLVSWIVTGMLINNFDSLQAGYGIIVTGAVVMAWAWLALILKLVVFPVQWRSQDMESMGDRYLVVTLKSRLGAIRGIEVKKNLEV